MTTIRAPWSQPYSVASILVTAPTEEPITLEQAKLRAGLDWPEGDPRDELMRGFIQAARSKVEQDTGLALLTQTRDVYYAAVEPWAVVPLPVQALPLQSIIPLSGDVVLVGPATLRVTATAAEGETAVRIVSGWPSVEDLQAEAPGLVHAVGLLTAHYATTGRDLAITGTIAQPVPYGYEDAIAPHRLIWVA